MRGNLFLRYVDRYFGIFILYLFGLFHTKRKKPTTINKVGIFKSAAIGDFVLLTAILNDIEGSITILNDELNKVDIFLQTEKSNASEEFKNRMLDNISGKIEQSE